MNDHDPHPIDDAELCTLYLLGELEDETLANFERRLAESPEWADCLVAHAELIDNLSHTHIDVAIRPVTHRTPWPAIAATVALAACLAWALLSWRPHLDDASGVALDASVMEELLIAKTWAGDPGTNLDSGTNLDELVELSEADDVGRFDLDEEVDLDSTLSWMVVAMSAGGEVVLEGDANDG